MTSASFLQLILKNYAGLLSGARGLNSVLLPATQSFRSYYNSSKSPNDSYYSSPRGEFHATTILCVRKEGKVVLIGDGQVSQGSMIVKPNAKKVRKIGEGVVAGFAGSAADGMSLLERLEMKLEEHPGQLMRAAVELAKQWRQDKALRFLQAELLVADSTTTLTVSGNGDVLEPHDGVMAIGSGGAFAVAAARALIDVPDMDAEKIASKAMKIASDMCVYTNNNFLIEVMNVPPASDSSKQAADLNSSSTAAAAATPVSA
ncbi:hypothetical protein CEUSTIGMA_g1854.t1 [Chlamydomonas eustigma]|uniref:Uncharacterized protein n=1 Tax=Chlamydomonas eustigma TaxID=1157962 RepID=A0A250WUH4_9CHLO|nr:hypothetical protein CEUSTIGMA_g1854.t1 [Chlamydomonas eustigma]|eukprot:GAX74406.1 hypothetical protein CEUSTIGMA_g1854.t1 [Chlamydomonas eustigma]